MSRTDPLAQPKAIGEDVEQLVIDTVDGLQAAENSEDWYDAVAETILNPGSSDLLTFGSVCVIEAGARVEIKSCKRSVSNGTGDRPGRWMLQIDQHERLLEAGAVYLLAVYIEVGSTKQLEHLLLVPASIIDEVLTDSWYEVDRHENEVAQLPWPHVIGTREVGDNAE